MVFIGCMLIAVGSLCAEPSVTVALRRDDPEVASRSAPVMLQIVVYGAVEHMSSVIDRVQYDLERSGSIRVQRLQGKAPERKEEIVASGAPFVWYFGCEANGDIVGHGYDAELCSLLQGRRWKARADLGAWGDVIAQDIWQALMGSVGSFTSKLAYVMRTKRGGQYAYELCLTAWDGARAAVLVKRNAAIVAPSFYRGEKGGVRWIFFSEFTPLNVRLCVAHEQGGVSCVVDRRGTTVGVDAGFHGEHALYCHSGDIWEYRYDEKAHKGMHERLITALHGIPCSHPYQCDNGDIIYGRGGSLFRWSCIQRESLPLIQEGYCVAPSVAEGAQLIAYAARVRGVMQIWVYNLETKRSRQVTQGSGNHVDPAISPCGMYVAYTHEEGLRSEVWITSLISGAAWRVSPEHEYCSYVAWSSLR